MKKRYAIVFILIIMISMLTGCSNKTESHSNFSTKEFEEGADFYLYNSLNEMEKAYYAHLCTAVESFKKEAIFTFKTEEERLAILETFFGGENMLFGWSTGGRWLYRDTMYEQAQYFWVNPNSVRAEISDYPKEDRYLLKVHFDYLMTEDEAKEKQAAFEQKVQGIVSEAKAAGDTFEQLLYVHDYLCENVVYDKELYESGEYDTPRITAYGALMEGKTMCSGYAQAFSLFMRELGYNAGVEFNNYGEITLFEGHVWNYVELEGEYYYFDVTWDDTDDENYSHMYEYFGITTDELKQTNYAKRDDAPVPSCNGTRYNYYVYNGCDVPVYSFDATATAILKQVQAGNSIIRLRFGDYGELLRAESELFTANRIYELTDVSSCSYGISRLPHLYLYIYL